MDFDILNYIVAGKSLTKKQFERKMGCFDSDKEVLVDQLDFKKANMAFNILNYIVAGENH
ncbi:MAG: hypothetical protein LBL21_04340 [Rickettsiales bacterium]|jgi:hypothetical protein|nr:hypothetical protein [Rickettsiales bacterium]